VATDAHGEAAPVRDERLRSDALDILDDVLHWWLTEPRWATVRAAVGRLSAATHRGDAGAVRAAVAELELLGPVRATAIGANPTAPVPDPVREEIDELVHTLDGRTPPAR
jgi:hypothetical protein